METFSWEIYGRGKFISDVQLSAHKSLELSSKMIEKSKLAGAINPCVKIFQFFGLADFFIPRRASARQKFAASWILIKYLAMMGILVALFVDFILGRINRLRDSNGIIIHLIIYIGTATEGFATLIQALASSSRSLKFMRRLREVDELLTNVLSIRIDYEDLRWTLLITTVSCLIYLLVNITASIFLILNIHPHFWRVLIHFNMPVLIGHIFVLRFIFMVQLLTYYLNLMIDTLEKSISCQPVLVRRDERRRWEWNMKSNHFKLKVMQKAYRRLWEASVLINECFDTGLLIIFVMYCSWLLYRGYSLCLGIANRQANNNIGQLIAMARTLFGVYSIHYYCQQCSNSVSLLINNHDSKGKYFILRLWLTFKAKRMAVLIHRLHNGVSSLSFHATMENFSQQLVHQRIRFSPFKLFKIDFANLVSVRLWRREQLCKGLRHFFDFSDCSDCFNLWNDSFPVLLFISPKSTDWKVLTTGLTFSNCEKASQSFVDNWSNLLA